MATVYTWKKYNVRQTYKATIKWSDSTTTFTEAGNISYMHCGSSAGVISANEYTLSNTKQTSLANLNNDTRYIAYSNYFPYYSYVQFLNESGAWQENVGKTNFSWDYVYKVKSYTDHSITVHTPSVVDVPDEEVAGDYISDVTSTKATAYPTNGKHTDGYWYVYQGSEDVNSAPVISGTNSNIGAFDLTPPTYSYTVTDAESNAVTVTEALDGKTIRSFTATLGASNSITIDALTWLKTLNGSHTITITATDSEGASSVRTLTLTKNVTSLSFTLETPLDADAQITKALESINAQIPAGAAISIEICNNGYDAAPTWEDVTQKVLKGEKIYFANTTKTAEKWGYNVRVNVQRNEAEGDCYVVFMTGFFE